MDTVKMRPEIKAEWVKRLRSGEYAQGEQVLKRTKKPEEGPPVVTYCCLGVLCVMAVEAGIVGERGDKNGNDDGRHEFTWTEEGRGIGPVSESQYLPPPVVEWAWGDEGDDEPFGKDNPIVEHPGIGTISLAGMNDGGRSFEEIAEAIERNF